jgi:hypothetical protein
MDGVPLDVVHIVIRLFKRIKRAYSANGCRRFCNRFRFPELYSPVNGTSEKDVGEVDRAGEGMEMQSRDWPVMAFVDVKLVQTSLGPRTIVSARLIHVALFSPRPERRRFIIGEVKCSDGNFICFVVPSVY